MWRTLTTQGYSISETDRKRITVQTKQNCILHVLGRYGRPPTVRGVSGKFRLLLNSANAWSSSHLSSMRATRFSIENNNKNQPKWKIIKPPPPPPPPLSTAFRSSHHSMRATRFFIKNTQQKSTQMKKKESPPFIHGVPVVPPFNESHPIFHQEEQQKSTQMENIKLFPPSPKNPRRSGRPTLAVS